MLNSILVDSLGYTALIINLYSMSVKGERKLRIISAIANSLYVVYGIFLSAYPIIIGCTIAVFLHTYRLRSLKKTIE